ncbi:probable ATP-dependent RNA helicase DHX34 [Diaphorina citri]|uniref:Probable ATP-dependent RNA helicase DHX34 n=1 Tax=Diaphorina citri TaxID=121845 RepID=A0A3Q0J6B2_DIACI|nr:probable ATP-dependent RNA helicase DHX34 [Diaphorina citri]
MLSGFLLTLFGCQRVKLHYEGINLDVEQRAFRRTGPGVCYRLYSEEQYSLLAEYSTPEIRRVSIDSLLLSLVCMGLGDVRKFPFLEAPPAENIESSVRSLTQHGAIDSKERVTTLGRFLSDLPVDIPLGKMLVFGSMFHQIDTIPYDKTAAL